MRPGAFSENDAKKYKEVFIHFIDTHFTITMAQVADDFEGQFSGGDAGASQTYPSQASAIKKGGHIMIKGHPCKVVEMSTSKTGKHGHAKVSNFIQSKSLTRDGTIIIHFYESFTMIVNLIMIIHSLLEADCHNSRASIINGF